MVAWVVQDCNVFGGSAVMVIVILHVFRQASLVNLIFREPYSQIGFYELRGGLLRWVMVDKNGALGQ